MLGGLKREILYYVDFNVVVLLICRVIVIIIDKVRVLIFFIDGCIIGGFLRSKVVFDLGMN